MKTRCRVISGHNVLKEAFHVDGGDQGVEGDGFAHCLSNANTLSLIA